MYALFLLLFSAIACADPLFYIPEGEYKKPYDVKQKTYMEVIYGDATTQVGQDFTSLNRFSRGRVNARSVIEAKDNTAKYSAMLDVQIGTDVNEDQSKMIYINRGYVQLQNVKEQAIQTKVRIGIQRTALTELAVNSSTPIKNSQGVNGNWYRYVQMPVVNQTGGYNPIFLLQSMPISMQGFTDATFLYSTNNVNGTQTLNYVQPSPWWSASNVGIAFDMNRFHGFKFAFSYQPSQNTGTFGVNGNGGYDRRGIKLDNQGQSMFTRDLTSFVLNYLNEFGGVALNASVGYEMAGYRVDRATVNFDRYKLSQYTAGLNLSYLGLTVGGSYSNAGKSTLIKHNASQVNSFSTRNANSITANSGSDLYNISQSSNLLNFKDTYNFDYGVSYAISRFQLGVAHANSRFADNRFHATIISLSDDISATQKMKLTALYEFGFYTFQASDYFSMNSENLEVISVPKVRGYMGSIGLRLSI